MKIPSFSLYQSLPKSSAQGKLDFEADIEHKVGQFIKAAPEMAPYLNALPKNLRRSIIDSSFGDLLDESPDPAAIDNVSRTLHELTGAPKVQTVGIWDLDTTIGELPKLVAELNTAQPRFAFFHVHASVPSTLVTPGVQLASFVEEKSGKGSLGGRETGNFDAMTTATRPIAKNNPVLNDNLMADYYMPTARKIRNEFGLDILVGITRHKIAFTENGLLYYNYFSISEGDEFLVSSYGMREYARRAEKPFRAAVGFLIVGQLLAKVNPKIDYHPETRGCLFDFNGSRDSIVESLKSFEIDGDCMRKITHKYRPVAQSFLAALKNISTSD
jgi:hypothetical protein